MSKAISLISLGILIQLALTWPIMWVANWVLGVFNSDLILTYWVTLGLTLAFGFLKVMFFGTNKS